MSLDGVSLGDRLFHDRIAGVFKVVAVSPEGVYLKHTPPKGFDRRDGAVMIEQLRREFTKIERKS